MIAIKTKRTFFAFLIFACMSMQLPALCEGLIDAAAPWHPGPVYPVQALNDCVLTDKSRNKQIHIKITYPTNGKNYPVIVFSHGAAGSQFSYAGLARYWAQHGYVVVQPTHDDSLSLMRKKDPTATVVDVLTSIGEDYKGWKNRARDISFVISSLPILNKTSPGKCDLTKIGMGGHSYGAFTGEMLDGAPVRGSKDGPEINLTDARPKAFLLMSAMGRGANTMAFRDEHSFATMIRPTMVMTGSLDFSPNAGGGARWRTEPYQFAPKGNKYLVFIDGANHMTFTDSKDRASMAEAGMATESSLIQSLLGTPIKADGIFSSARDDKMFGWVEELSLAFWDTYLKGSESAHKYLTSEYMQKATHGVVKMDHK